MLTLGIACIVTLLDQFIKWIVVTHMEWGESIPLIPGVFHLTYILNPGAAFGILAYQRWFFLLIVNAIDRVRLSGVIDFFDFRIWPIFNIADIFICVGVALIVFYFWRHDS